MSRCSTTSSRAGTGLDVLRTVRAWNSRVAFVVFTNNASSGFRKHCLAEGAAGFLDKATELDEQEGWPT